MASGNAIRGSRVGAGPMGEAERGDAAPASTSPTGAPTGTRPARASPRSRAWSSPRPGTARAAACPPGRTRTTRRPRRNRAVQDAPGLREGAAQRRRRRRPSSTRPSAAARPRPHPARPHGTVAAATDRSVRGRRAAAAAAAASWVEEPVVEACAGGIRVRAATAWPSLPLTPAAGTSQPVGARRERRRRRPPPCRRRRRGTRPRGRARGARTVSETRVGRRLGGAVHGDATAPVVVQRRRGRGTARRRDRPGRRRAAGRRTGGQPVLTQACAA